MYTFVILSHIWLFYLWTGCTFSIGYNCRNCINVMKIDKNHVISSLFLIIQVFDRFVRQIQWSSDFTAFWRMWSTLVFLMSRLRSYIADMFSQWLICVEIKQENLMLTRCVPHTLHRDVITCIRYMLSLIKFTYWLVYSSF